MPTRYDAITQIAHDREPFSSSRILIPRGLFGQELELNRSPITSPSEQKDAQPVSIQQGGYLVYKIAEHQDHRIDDVMVPLIGTELNGERRDDDPLGPCQLLLVAGIDTT